MFSTLRRLRHGPLRRLGPVWLGLGRIYRKAVARTDWFGPVSQKIGPYGPFFLHPNFAFSSFETWGSGHNRGFANCIESAKGLDCVLDVGGHIGLVALPLSRAVSPPGRVFVFEPAEGNLKYLRKHLDWNHAAHVEIVPNLVGAVEKQAEIYETDGPSGMNSMASSTRGTERYRPVLREQTTLDAFCSARKLSPQLIKIDVEGAELGVLQGARATLARCRPKIFLSVHPPELRQLGTSAEELARFVRAEGYEIHKMSGELFDSDSLGFDEYLLTPKSS